jgi:hypothetical protein
MSYSARDIEKAFDCVGYKKDRTVQETRGWVFAHLEGRCRCDVDRCPHCGERKRNGMSIHKISCKMAMK